jgi:hypothetical protein
VNFVASVILLGHFLSQLENDYGVSESTVRLSSLVKLLLRRGTTALFLNEKSLPADARCII